MDPPHFNRWIRFFWIRIHLKNFKIKVGNIATTLQIIGFCNYIPRELYENWAIEEGNKFSQIDGSESLVKIVYVH